MTWPAHSPLRLASAVALLLALPLPALGAAPTSALTMPALTAAVRELAGQTRGIAFSYFFFAFVLALVLEMFSTSPTAPRDYAGVVWRAVLVLFLLTFYPRLFPPLFGAAHALADSLAPTDAWSQLSTQARAAFDQHMAANAAEDTSLTARALTYATRLGLGALDIGTAGLLTSFILVCQTIHWVMATLATLLQGLFYILGPLALVASLPRASAIGSRWFTNLLTLAAWPVISGLLARITLAIGMQTFITTGLFGALAAALLMAALALATPVIASAIVGGSIKDLITPAVQTLGHTSTMLGNAITTASHLPAAAASTASAAAHVASATHIPQAAASFGQAVITGAGITADHVDAFRAITGSGAGSALTANPPGSSTPRPPDAPIVMDNADVMPGGSGSVPPVNSPPPPAPQK